MTTQTLFTIMNHRQISSMHIVAGYRRFDTRSIRLPPEQHSSECAWNTPTRLTTARHQSGRTAIKFNVTDRLAATIDCPLPIRPTSPLQCVGWFSASDWRWDVLTLQAEPVHHANRWRCRHHSLPEAFGVQRAVHQGSHYVSSSLPPRNSIGVQISMPSKPSSVSKL